MTIEKWLADQTIVLQQAEISSASLDATVIAEHVLGKSREWLIAHGDTELSIGQLDYLNTQLDQRKNHVPLAYIIGSKEFYGRTFFVNEDVLIPRPESEAMIELLLDVVNRGERVGSETMGAANGTSKELDSHLCGNDDQNLTTHHSPLTTIIDIGTGSGCLAITAQLELPQATVVATDISEAALALAAKNAQMLKAPVQFYNANLLDIPEAIKPDIILANLPYVPGGLVTSEEITKEPALAIFSGKDGFEAYRIFWQQLTNLVHQPRAVITESLQEQHKQMEYLAKHAGYTLNASDVLAQLFTLR